MPTSVQKKQPSWVRVTVREDQVMLCLGDVEKAMTADAAVRLAFRLVAAARESDSARLARLYRREGAVSRDVVTRDILDAIGADRQKAQVLISAAETLRTAAAADSPARALGNRGGALGNRGGLVRAQNLSPERRREIARKAANARWKNGVH